MKSNVYDLIQIFFNRLKNLFLDEKLFVLTSLVELIMYAK